MVDEIALDDRITFEDFIQMMEQVENRLARDDPHNLNRQDFLK